MDDVKQGLIVLHTAVDLVARVLKLSHIELEVLRHHFDDLRGRLVGVDIGIFILEVIKLVIHHALDDIGVVALAGFLKDKAIKDGGAVHGKTAGVPLLKAQAWGLYHLKGELARLAFAFPLNGDTLHRGWVHDIATMLYQQLIAHGMVSTCPG